MKTYKFILTTAQVEGVSSLWAFKREGDEDELIPLDIPAAGTLVNMKDGGQVVIFPLQKAAKIVNRTSFPPVLPKHEKPHKRKPASNLETTSRKRG